jgi:hypothetical protein
MRYLWSVPRDRRIFPTQLDRSRARRLLLEHGDHRASDLLDLDRMTLLRLAAQVRVYPSTVERFRAAYARSFRADEL